MADGNDANLSEPRTGLSTGRSLARERVLAIRARAAIAELCSSATTTQASQPLKSCGPGSDATPGAPLDSRRQACEPRGWGRFRLLALLGIGAYGEVYRALDTELDREVALKLLRPSRSNPEHALQLLDEARMLAQVRHPNVASIHGVAEHDGRAGFWMELVNGVTLEELLRTQGPRSAGEAALVGRGLCRALAAVHGAGLVHGDIKTANVMRETGGRIVLMDFGAGGCRGCESNGRIRGTPLYIAPEVLAGSPASALSDIYGLGVVLFRLVTTAYPRKVGRLDDLVEPVELGPSLSLHDLRPELPAAFVSVVERAIAREPASRPETAGALHAALGVVLGVPAS